MERAFVGRLRKVAARKYKGKVYYNYIVTVPARVARQLEAGKSYIVVIKNVE